MLFRWRIKDNEPCPCGSDKLFRDCCKGKTVSSPSPSRKPPEVQIMEKMRSSMTRCCLHPDQANCKGRIKEAHALQNNKIISLLAGHDRHVYMLDAKKQPLLVPLDNGEVIPFVEISRTSANNATTETCFCDLHDNIVFAAIEKGAPNFDNSDIMKFTYAYKAFIFEYYKQTMGMKIYRQCYKENPQAFKGKDSVAMYRMFQLKEKGFEPIKRHFDSQILSGTCNGVYTCVVEIPEQTKSWLLMSCLDSERKIYEALFKQMQEASVQKIKYYLNLVLPLYSENMVLSPTLWNSWTENIRNAYTYYANLNGPEAIKMEMCLGFALKNAFRDKSGATYNRSPRINLFP